MSETFLELKAYFCCMYNCDVERKCERYIHDVTFPADEQNFYMQIVASSVEGKDIAITLEDSKEVHISDSSLESDN